jgi:hypothetical protein
MGLAGEGAVAIWHDIAPEGRDEFYAWHGEEHMPERVGIPGFLRGRRYVALRAGGAEFFNLYETDRKEVVSGPDYLERLNNPTPWTAATVKHFRNVARSVCQVAATLGHAQGGLIATWRYDVPAAREEEHRKAITERILPAVARKRLVAGAHLLIADADASAVVTAERKARGGPDNLIPRWILLVESWGDEQPFEALCRDALSDQVLREAGASGPAEMGLYRLQTSRAKTARTAG